MGVKVKTAGTASNNNNNNNGAVPTNGVAVHSSDGVGGRKKKAGRDSARAPEADVEAKQWAECVHVLKSTTDAMHEICAFRRNALGCEEALMYLTNAVRDFQALISAIQVESEWENLENRPQALAWEVKGSATRKAGGFTKSKQELKQRQIMGTKSDNVYGRSASHSKLGSSLDSPLSEDSRPGCTSGRFSATPRSAMDIPQTKSSMAKIAYSRQLLWQRHKKLLTEKLTARRKQQRELTSLTHRRSSLPVLAGKAVPKNLDGNLESINEEDRNSSDSLSMKTHVGCSKSEPRYPCLNMNDDDEWKALTEEEESLAHEEASLKKEIEDEENFSIEDEMDRHVVLDFSDVDMNATREKSWKVVVDEWDVHHETSLEPEDHTETEARFREPGATAKLHQRLLSPVRKKKYDTDWVERQQKAEEVRILIREQKAQRLKELHLRVDEIRRKRAELVEKKRLHLEKKMEKATENRQRNLENVVKQAKDVDQRVMEINFINSFQAETARFDLQQKAQDREQRIQGILDVKVRQYREKVQRETEVEERRRMVDEERRQRLQKETEKNEARQRVAEYQRSEHYDLCRKKARGYALRIDELRREAAEDEKRPLSRVQEADEVSLCSTRSLTDSRLISGWASLADSLTPPSDSATDPKSYSWTCSACKVEVSSTKTITRRLQFDTDLDVLTHFCSTDHYTARGISNVEFGNVLLRAELTACVSSSRVEHPESSETSSSEFKKLKNKLAKRCSKSEKTSTEPLSKFSKKFDEFSKQLSSSPITRLDEKQRRKFEMCIGDWSRDFLKLDQNEKVRCATALAEHGSIDRLLTSVSHAEEASKVVESRPLSRLACKALIIVIELLSFKQSTKVFVLNGGALTLLSLLESKCEGTPEIDEITASSLLMLKNVVSNLDAENFADSELATVRLFCQTLLSTNVTTLLTACLSSEETKIQLPFNSQFGSIEFVAFFFVAFSRLSLRLETKSYHAVKNTIDLMVSLTSAVYNLICAAPLSASGDSLTSSVITSSSVGGMGFEQQLMVVASCWSVCLSTDVLYNALKKQCSERSPTKFAVQTAFILSHLFRSWSAKNAEAELEPKRSIAFLHNIVGFVSLHPLHQRLAMLGWQASMAVQLSDLPVRYFQYAELRHAILTALILITYENPEGLALIDGHISRSWLRSHAEQLLSETKPSTDRSTTFLSSDMAKVADYFRAL